MWPWDFSMSFLRLIIEDSFHRLLQLCNRSCHRNFNLKRGAIQFTDNEHDRLLRESSVREIRLGYVIGEWKWNRNRNIATRRSSTSVAITATIFFKWKPREKILVEWKDLHSDSLRVVYILKRLTKSQRNITRLIRNVGYIKRGFFKRWSILLPLVEKIGLLPPYLQFWGFYMAMATHRRREEREREKLANHSPLFLLLLRRRERDPSS